VLEAVAERNPELVKEATREAEEGALIRSSSTVPAAMDEAESAGAELTPIDRIARDRDDPSKRLVQEHAAEALLNGTAPSTAPSGGTQTPAVPGNPSSAPNSTASLDLDIEVITSGGPNYVQVSSPTSLLAKLNDNQLSGIISTGDTAPLGPQLLGILNTNGVDPIQFARQLQSLLH
jgi:hypothetical protein